MKRIAIFTCLKTTAECAGCGCMKAYNRKTGTFEEYANQEVELLSFFQCSRCIEQEGAEPDKNLIKKLDRLVSESVQKVHIGICTKKNGVKCPGAKMVQQLLQERGIATVEGTHPRHGNR